MDPLAPQGVQAAPIAASEAHVLRLIVSDNIVPNLLKSSERAFLITVVSGIPVLEMRTPNGFQSFPIHSGGELLRLLENNPRILLTLVTSTSEGVISLRGQVQHPIQTQIFLRIEPPEKSFPNPQSFIIEKTNLPLSLQLISRISPDRVSSVLMSGASFPTVGQSAFKRVESHATIPAELAKSVVQSIQALGGGKSMLIPDVSLAMPRPIAPDSMPMQMPIKQPVAAELGLKAGQVVQALVSSSGEKMTIQLGNQQLPVPQGLKLPDGQLAMRVVQTPQGLVLSSQLSAQAQTGQASAVSGLSAALASVLARSGLRHQIQGLFAPTQGLEVLLKSAGLPLEAQALAAERLISTQLSGKSIALAMEFGSLSTEKALLEGVAFQGGMLKPWLRQLLRLLPQQSQLSMKVGDVLGELESFQLDALPQQNTRESGMVALLLFRDQPPVEVMFERREEIDGETTKRIWVINLHTSLDDLGRVWLKSSFDSKQVELTFWAEKSSTATLARQSKMDLEEALSEHGLTVRSMQIFGRSRPGHDDRLNGDLPRMDLKA